MKYWISSAIAVLSMACAGAAHSKDRCEFFSGLNQTGSKKIYELRDANVAGQPWSNISTRHEGAHLKGYAPAIYKNLESVRIVAMGSDVTLYVYDGDNFDGKFQALRAKKGTVFVWNFGSMRNRVRSIICQRDPRLPADLSRADLLIRFQNNHLVPTSLLADAMTAAVHDAVKTQRSRFYNHRIDIKQGRMIWETALEECRRVRCVDMADEDKWRRKYWDLLRYSYQAIGRLKADGKKYTISIDIWIMPFLDNEGRLRFRGDAWKVSVSQWIWHRRIKDAVAGQVKIVFDSIGPMIESELTKSIRRAVGDEGVKLLRGNDRLIFSYSCNSIIDRVGYPNYNYSSFQVADICGGQTPESVVAPGLRLVRE